MPIIVRQPKISLAVREAAAKMDMIPVFVALKNQPQRRVLEYHRGVHSLRLQMAQGRYQAIADRAAITKEDMEVAHKEIDEINALIAKKAVEDIDQAIGADLDVVVKDNVVIISPPEIIHDTVNFRFVCDQANNQKRFINYHGDGAYDPYNEDDGGTHPFFASFAFEMDAYTFAKAHIQP